ncbi:YdaU family protein [Bartonella taylorii]|uniref:YdaU family protein n=1 Tax=Bartonella taylorii TaxID=33046 RepID=A0A9Q8YWD2_BARTA|nr:YdaU family protein [Bartonella taylorii]USP02163.1 YdaU family protein [Bartonella taylorii]
MSSKIPWTRLFADRWILGLACLSPIECNVYIKLRLQMLYTGKPLLNNMKVWANYTGCSVKMFMKALDVLMNTGHIARLEDGCLWSTDVEEELNNCNESLEKVSKISRSKRLSERAQKAAQARWEKHKNDAKTFKHNANGMLKDAKQDAYDMLKDAYIYNINNNTNSYNKKTNTIVLAKKEINFENLEIRDQVDKPTKVHDYESQPEQIATGAENQSSLHEQSIDTQCNTKPQWNINDAMLDKIPSRNSPKVAKTLAEIVGDVLPSTLHEQESVLKKTKRVRTDRGCRLPDDFEPDYDFAIAEGLSPEHVKVEIAKFRDYWKAKTGKDATKTDWQATWRNWVRNSKKYKINKLGANNERFSKNQRISGGTGATIRNLIGAT